MSTIRQNDKRQIRVPSKLIDSDYGIKVNKTKKKSKNRVLNNEIGDSEEYVKVQEGNSGIEADLQEKSYEVKEDSGNRGAKVVETVIDKDEDELVSPDSGSKSNSPDSWSWTLNNSGGYTVASSRNMIDSRLLRKVIIKTRVEFDMFQQVTLRLEGNEDNIPTRFYISDVV
ncbi:hypothetical protein Tco_1144585 [Tanacetum coccineum]